MSPWMSRGVSKKQERGERGERGVSRSVRGLCFARRAGGFDGFGSWVARCAMERFALEMRGGLKTHVRESGHGAHGLCWFGQTAGFSAADRLRGPSVEMTAL